jgi:hypothetical protein
MTNSRSLSWIDRGRWEGLLAQITDEPAPVYRPPPRPAPRAMPAGTLPPIRRAVSNVLSTIQIAVPPAPRRARSNTSPIAARPRHPARPLPDVPAPPTAAPAPVAAPPRVSYPPFVAPSRQLEERLQALVAWIEACVPCHAAFIADDNGLPVVEHVGAEAGHVAAASSILLMLASVRTLMRDSGGWLSLKLGAQVLNVVEVATRWGRFGIGVVTEDALPREFLLALSEAVERAFHGEPSPGEAT